MIIPRVSEAIDAELLKQDVGLRAMRAVDTERFALAAIEEIANQLDKEGFHHPARWLRSQMTEGR